MLGHLSYTKRAQKNTLVSDTELKRFTSVRLSVTDKQNTSHLLVIVHGY